MSERERIKPLKYLYPPRPPFPRLVSVSMGVSPGPTTHPAMNAERPECGPIVIADATGAVDEVLARVRATLMARSHTRKWRRWLQAGREGARELGEALPLRFPGPPS